MNPVFRYLGYVFSFRQNIVTIPGDPDRPCVILVHGLLHRGFLMEKIADYLNRMDHRNCLLYDYPTSSGTLREHAVHFRMFLGEQLNRFPRVELVTHSMGGLLARVALDTLAPEEKSRIGRIVMLAPPNHGSPEATFYNRLLPFAGLLVPPVPDLRDVPAAAVHQLPVPQGFEIGVIAGSRDHKAPIASTHLETETDHIVLDAAHAFIMNKPEVQRQTLFFLQNGRFDRE